MTLTEGHLSKIGDMQFNLGDEGEIARAIVLLKVRRRELLLEKQDAKRRIACIRAESKQRLLDLQVVRGSIKKNLIAFERMSRDSDIKSILLRCNEIDVERGEIDRILLSLQRLP